MTDEDGLCIADVLARRSVSSTNGIAFEVQWSPQTAETTQDRTDRYTRHGLRSLWLMRRPPLLVSKTTPIARLVPNGDGFDVYLPSAYTITFRDILNSRELNELDSSWRRCGTLTDFVKGVVSGRFRFGVAENFALRIVVRGAPQHCIHCRRAIKAASSITLDLGHLHPDYPDFRVGINELGSIDGTLRTRIIDGVNQRLGKVGGCQLAMCRPKLKLKSYLANSCTGNASRTGLECPGFVGRTYLPDYDEEQTLFEFTMDTSAHEIRPFLVRDDRWCFVDPDNPSPKRVSTVGLLPRFISDKSHAYTNPYDKDDETGIRKEVLQ
jgi:competence protein CoiA